MDTQTSRDSVDILNKVPEATLIFWRTYAPWIYWLTVVLVSIVGTQITDALTDGLSIRLYISTVVFAVCLAMLGGIEKSVSGCRASRRFA